MADTTADTIELFETVLCLKRLPRTGWLLAGVVQPESIADHSFGTAMVACFLAELVNLDYAGSSLEQSLDVGRVARIALVHDLAESLVTDLPRQTSELLGQDIKHTAEHNAMGMILSRVVGGSDYLALWQEYESGVTPEARMVRDADKLEMVMQARQYTAAGNSNLDEFWQGHEWNYDESRSLFERLCSDHGTDK